MKVWVLSAGEDYVWERVRGVYATVEAGRAAAQEYVFTNPPRSLCETDAHVYRETVEGTLCWRDAGHNAYLLLEPFDLL